MRRLGSGWSIFVEAQRSEAATYPDSTFPDPASALLDAERKAAFEEAGAHFVSGYFLTFLYMPPAEEAARAETWLYEGREQKGLDAHEVLAQLRQALAENRFELAYFPVYSRDWKLLHRESALRLRLAGSGELIPAGHFMPYVLRLGMAAEIDLLAVRLALQEIQTTQQAIAVNLSADSIRSATFRQQLQTELESAGTQASQLWLEINEFGLRDEMAILAAFAAQIAHHGCKIGIEHFGRHVFDTIPQLYELHLGYLKIDGSFIHDLDKQPGNQYLIRAIASVASGMGILTIAEQISTEMEWQMVVSLGIDGGTGPAMHQPGPD